MRAFIRSLSGSAEFLIVVLTAFGLPALASFIYLYGLLSSPDGASLGFYSSGSLYRLVFYEVAVLLVITVILRWRGWRLRDLNPEISLKLTLGGVLLAVVTHILFINMFILFAGIFPSVRQFGEMFADNVGRPDIYSAVLLSVINPVYEEVIVAGYVITALKEKKGVHFAINTSVAIRFLYHVYEGSIGAISIIPMGLLFAYVYVRTERLWPLIVAHTLLDFYALSAIM